MVPAPAQVLALYVFFQQPKTKPACEYINGKLIKRTRPRDDIFDCGVSSVLASTKSLKMQSLPTLSSN